MISEKQKQQNRDRIKEKLLKEKEDKETKERQRIEDEELRIKKINEAKEREDFAVRIAEEIKGVLSSELKEVISGIEKLKIDTPEIPEIKLPEIVLPKIELPEITIPEIKLPTLVIPKIESPVIPDIVIPDIVIPEISVPDIIIPKIVIPEMPAIPFDKITEAINKGIKKGFDDYLEYKKGTSTWGGGGGIGYEIVGIKDIDGVRQNPATEDKQDLIKTAIDNKELIGNTQSDGSGTPYHITTDSSGRLHTRSFKNAAGEGRRMLVDSDRHGQVDVLSMPTGFNTNEILEVGTDTYFCKETASGEWYIMKIDINSIFTHATILNNVGIANYADARSGYAGLTYETYDNAF